MLAERDVLLLSQLSGRGQFPAALGQQRLRVSSIIIHRPQEVQTAVQPVVIGVVESNVSGLSRGDSLARG